MIFFSKISNKVISKFIISDEGVKSVCQDWAS